MIKYKIIYILGSFIILLNCCTQNTSFEDNDCEGYIFVKGADNFKNYLVLRFMKNNKFFYVLTDTIISNDQQKNLQRLKSGNCYTLNLNKLNSIKTLEKKYKILTPEPVKFYWNKNENSLFLIGDSLVVDVYTSENLLNYYYRK